MRDVLETIKLWQAQGQRVATATVVEVEGSAPRDPGAVLAVNERGDVAGSVSGGCVEAAVCVEAQAVIASQRARLITYGISEANATALGLGCGGTIQVLVACLDTAIVARLSVALQANQRVALITQLDGERAGAKLLVLDAESMGHLGSQELTQAAIHEARSLLANGAAALRRLAASGEPADAAARVFIEVFAPRPDMYIFGAIDYSQAMAHIGKFLGYTVTVVDARPVFATLERVPDADRVVVAWPDAFLTRAPVDERTALIVLTHDAKFDIPLLRVALGTAAGYIGAMGSRRTHANRIDELRRSGCAADQLARISAPIGLDIGARTLAETAISIAAEIVALREVRRGGRLAQSDLPVHNPRPTVKATALDGS